MNFGLSYTSGTTEPESRNQPWVVLADRDGITSYQSRACQKAFKPLAFLQSFYVKELDLQRRSAHLVYAQVGASEGFLSARISEDWGWAKLDDLLLSHRPFRDPDNFIPESALVVSEMTQTGVAKVPSLYASPATPSAAAPRELRRLEYTDFFYIYKVWPANQPDYDSKWGYQWYLVSDRPFLSVRPGSELTVQPDKYPVGWLKGKHVLIWNTREALEPKIGRQRGLHVFEDSANALAYAVNGGDASNAYLLDPTKYGRTWVGQRFRYPLIGQMPEAQGTAQARFLAYQGRVRFDKGDFLPDYSELETALHSLDLTLNLPKVIFIFDGTVSMCDSIIATVQAAREILQEIESKGIQVEVGAAVYRDKADGFHELETFRTTKNVTTLLEALQRINCTQKADDDYEESLFKGLYDAWDKAAGAEKDTYVTYILMGDAGSSSKDSRSLDDVATALSGVDPLGNGQWNLFSFHAFRILNPPRNAEEGRAMEKFRLDVKDGLLNQFQQRQEQYSSKLPPDLRKSVRSFPHSYGEVDVSNPLARREAARQIAGYIQSMVSRLEIMKDRVDELLATGRPLAGNAPGSSPAPPRDDRPLATAMMNLYLTSRIGDEGLKEAKQQRTQIFYKGWVATRDAEGNDVASPVLFLSRREQGDLWDIARSLLEHQDCESVKGYFRNLIGKVAPEDLKLPITVLIQKKRGFRFQSPLLKVPYSELDTLCSNENAKLFNRLLVRFEDLNRFMESMVNAPDEDASASRKYRLRRDEYFWIPMDRLP